jgi:hypothetical protein
MHQRLLAPASHAKTLAEVADAPRSERLFALCFRDEGTLQDFVRQLTTFLDRPAGQRYRAQSERLQAWACVFPDDFDWGARLYLSDVAFVAAEAAGLRSVITDGILRDDLPTDCWRIF